MKKSKIQFKKIDKLVKRFDKPFHYPKKEE